MTNLGKFLIALALVLGAAGSILGVLHLNSASYGSTGQPSTVDPNPQWLSGGITVGMTGTFDQNTQFGTCNLIGGAGGVTATSTANFDCAVSGVQPGDTVLGDLGANAPFTVGGGFVISKAVASSTRGYITFTLLNLTGAASTTLGVNLTNGLEYFTLR